MEESLFFIVRTQTIIIVIMIIALFLKDMKIVELEIHLERKDDLLNEEK